MHIGRRSRWVLGEFQRQSQLILRAAGLLRGLVQEFTSVQDKAAVIADAEREGDDITHNIVRALNRAPNDVFDREDLHRLAMRLDDVLDEIDAVAERLVIYRIEIPTSACRAMAEVVAATVGAMDRAIGCLRNLDPAFEEHAVEVNRLANVADVLLRRSVAELFETLRDPVEVLKWKEIYETLEAVTDRCEDVTDVVEGLILKQT
jgi:predicted phosphate transport protein (TIGR00153 family)